MEYQQMSSQTNDGCLLNNQDFFFYLFLTGFTEILNTTKTTNNKHTISNQWMLIKNNIFDKTDVEIRNLEKCDCYHLTLKNLIHEWKRKYIQIGFDFYFNSRECAPRYKWNKWFACMFFFSI